MSRTLTLADLAVTDIGELAEHPERPYVQRAAATVKNTEPEPLLGRAKVYTKGGLWFYREDYRGGSMRSQGFATRAEVEADMVCHAQLFWDLWEDRAANYEEQLAEGGKPVPPSSQYSSRAPRRHYVVADGVIRTLGATSTPRDLCGHAGRTFTFRLLATGEEIVSHNVWFGGEIPAEFLDRMPDNCEIVPEPPVAPPDFGQFT